MEKFWRSSVIWDIRYSHEHSSFYWQLFSSLLYWMSRITSYTYNFISAVFCTVSKSAIFETRLDFKIIIYLWGSYKNSIYNVSLTSIIMRMELLCLLVKVWISWHSPSNSLKFLLLLSFSISFVLNLGNDQYPLFWISVFSFLVVHHIQLVSLLWPFFQSHLTFCIHTFN